MFLFIIFVFLLNKNIFLVLKLSIKFNLEIEFLFSFSNLIFSLVVIIISIGVILYKKFYFHFIEINSFNINLIIFIISIIILINRNNFLTLIIGWDGLGISSFYLVSFYSNIESAVSRLITFFFNRLGDGFIVVVIAYILEYSTEYKIINLDILIFIIFIGLITKSSQLPFGVWLPIAIAAPTPISTLVHSSTLVTSGILILMKIEFLFFLWEFQILILIFGIFTFVIGGLFSLSILDLKKTVAFSTLSQLGFIIFRFRIGNLNISFLHIIFHAFFKSSLFLNLGFFIFKNLSIQDSRLINNYTLNFLSKILFLIPCLNLIGIIFSAGFISKDLILIFFINENIKIIIFFFLYIGCVITASYSIKLIFRLFKINLLSIKVNFKINFNFYFILIFIFSLILRFIIILLILFFINLQELFCRRFSKYLFLIILIFSFILYKIFFIFLCLLKFSSILIILDSINIFFRNKYLILKNISIILILEEFVQLNFFIKMNFSLINKVKFLILFILNFFLINVLIIFILI